MREIAGHVKARLPSWFSREDLEADGQLGLIQAARSYDPSRGSFRMWAHYRIRGVMLDFVRRELSTLNIGYGAFPSVGSELPGDYKSQQPILFRWQTPQDHTARRAVRNETHQLLIRAIRRLPNRDRLVITRTHLWGQTLDQVGQRIGMRGPGACAVRKQAMGRLRLVLEGMGLTEIQQVAL